MRRGQLGPAQLVLTSSVARRYFIEGMSKVQIANDLDLSRFKVARLLDLARSSGLVRIEIAHPGDIDVATSSDLRDAFGLQHALVVDTLEEDSAVLRQQVGKAAASLLSEIVTPADVLGLGWSRTLIATVAQLTEPGRGLGRPAHWRAWPSRGTTTAPSIWSAIPHASRGARRTTSTPR